MSQRYTYADYEQAKMSWLAKNPHCTPEQYTAAMQRISARMRL